MDRQEAQKRIKDAFDELATARRAGRKRSPNTVSQNACSLSPLQHGQCDANRKRQLLRDLLVRS